MLGSDAALHKAQAKNLLGADLDVIVGKDSTVVQSDVSETQAIPYSVADGALLDLSVKGLLSGFAVIAVIAAGLVCRIAHVIAVICKAHLQF